MMTGNVCINKCLCYIQNNIPKHPCALVTPTVNGLFTDDEVSNVKSLIYSILDDLRVPNLQRFIKWQGDNKRKLEVEDIITLILFADSAGVTLPVFVNLQRVPTVSPGDVDVHALAASVAALTTQLEELWKKAATDDQVSRRVAALESNFNSLSSGSLSSSGQVSMSVNDFPPLHNSANDQAACNARDNANANWLNVASSGDLGPVWILSRYA